MLRLGLVSSNKMFDKYRPTGMIMCRSIPDKYIGNCNGNYGKYSHYIDILKAVYCNQFIVEVRGLQYFSGQGPLS